MKRLIGIAGTVTSALAIAACASYDRDQTESTIIDDLSPQVEEVTGTSIKSATCPEEVDIEKGTKFACTATLKSGTKVKVIGAVVNDDGEIQVDITPEALGKAAGTS
ncbi:MAG TPA: DUF4333 domain-containing protein [Solirubrobacterales bacterium]